MKRGVLQHAWLLMVWVVGCAVVAPKADYADYREVRLARGEGETLLAMREYLSQHPDGVWAADIRERLHAREDDVYAAHRHDIEGLKLYLRAYPQGRYAVKAKAQLEAMKKVAKRKRAEREKAAALEQKRRAEAAERRRTWVGRFVGYWVERLLQLQGWGEPLAEVAPRNPAFAEAYGKPPEPRCNPERCIKFYTSDYAIPVPGGTRIERTLHLVLRLGLRRGRLERAELLVPDHGFSRWYELEQRNAVVDDDPLSRAQALKWAEARLEALLKGADPTLRAHSDAELPAVAALKVSATGERIDPTLQSPEEASGEEGDTHPSDSEADLTMQPADVAGGTPTAASEEDTRRPHEASADVSEEGDTTVVMEPAQVGRAAQDAGASQPPSTREAAPRGPRVQAAWATQGLRVVMFVGLGDDGMLDGLVVEPIEKGNARRSRPGRGRSRRR